MKTILVQHSVKVSLTLAVFLAFFASAFAAAATLGERLGFGPDQKILIVHADDLGSVRSANQAALDDLKFGVVRAASIMMSAPAAAEAIQYAQQHPDADLGIHLTLTSEWRTNRWGPLSPPFSVRSLIDSDGGFHDGLFWLFMLGRRDDVVTEMETQIRAALDTGWRPTHIDTHQGSIFLRPSWLAGYLRLAKKYQIPPMVPKWSDQLGREFAGPAAQWPLKLLAPRVLGSAEDAGFLTLDHLYMRTEPADPANSFEARKQMYLDILRHLQAGVTQIIIHPAYDDFTLARILASDASQLWRDRDARIFQDPDIKAEIERQNIRLIGWREIGAAYDWSKVRDIDASVSPEF